MGDDRELLFSEDLSFRRNSIVSCSSSERRLPTTYQPILIQIAEDINYELALMLPLERV